MTNKQLRAAIKSARYEMERDDIMRVERTLAALPPIRRKSVPHRLAVALPATAAVLVIFFFAMPPIVSAVDALVERIFQARIDPIEQYQALPEDERVIARADEMAASHRGHDVEGARVDFEGVVISVDYVSMSRDSDDPALKSGDLSLTLAYSDIPPFDPNWADFTLHYDGKAIPFSNYVKGHRAGKPLLTEAEWNDMNLTFESHTTMQDGVLKTSVHFPVDDWQLTQKTDMVVEGVIDGKRFEIPFAFDPDAAREAALRQARAFLAISDRGAAERLRKLNEYAAHAVPVGAHGQLSDMPFTIAEIARTDSELHLAVTVSGITEKNLRTVGYLSDFEQIYIDGRSFKPYEMDNVSLEDGVFSYIAHFYLAEFEAQLPEESLICAVMLNVEPGEGEGFDAVSIETHGYAAFKINWGDGTVTLPQDDTEREAWLAQGLPSREQMDIDRYLPGPMKEEDPDAWWANEMYDEIMNTKNLPATPVLSADWRNVLLLGSDARDISRPGNADAIMIGSVNMLDGRIKLTSIMGDMMVPVADPTGETRAIPIKSVARSGGPEAVMQLINELLGMNMTEYALIDFVGFQKVIDILDGIRMDITEAEMQEINKSLGEQAKVAGMDQQYYFEHCDDLRLKAYGTDIMLTGTQALGYARILRTGKGEVQRTERQQAVLNAVLRKVKGVMGVSQMTQVAGLMFECIETNIDVSSGIELATTVLNNSSTKIETLRLPLDNTATPQARGDVTALWDTDFEANKQALYQFIDQG